MFHTLQVGATDRKLLIIDMIRIFLFYTFCIKNYNIFPKKKGAFAPSLN